MTTDTGRRIETVVVGAGQAGLALSRHLTTAGRPHVLLERGRVGERWRSERWSSLTLLSPAWANLLPGQELVGDPGAFHTRDRLVDGFERYARSFHAPVVEGAFVRSARPGRGGWRVDTGNGRWLARNVVVATGDAGLPAVPAVAATAPPVVSLHSSRYRSADRLPPGGVLVVGAGPSGQQLALELARAGRQVTIAVGRHARLPRRYRGRDIWEWLYRLGDLDVTIDEVPETVAARTTPSVAITGSNGGERLDLGVLDAAGIDVRGRLLGFSGTRALFGDGLRGDIDYAEERMRRILSRVDELAASEGDLSGPEHVEALDLPDTPASLDLRAAGVRTILWATGYRRSYPWLHAPVLDDSGEIVQHHGITAAPGLYTLGLRFQRRRSSHFIGGVAGDAALIAARIAEGNRRPLQHPATRRAGSRSVLARRRPARRATATLG
jgi:putative flavoprotein involved in K+ transport